MHWHVENSCLNMNGSNISSLQCLPSMLKNHMQCFVPKEKHNMSKEKQNVSQCDTWDETSYKKKTLAKLSASTTPYRCGWIDKFDIYFGTSIGPIIQTGDHRNEVKCAGGTWRINYSNLCHNWKFTLAKKIYWTNSLDLKRSFTKQHTFPTSW